ncbi:MAG: molybdate ABC transporter substrate-binding protein [Cyanobacteria bacterium J06639_16]
MIKRRHFAALSTGALITCLGVLSCSPAVVTPPSAGEDSADTTVSSAESVELTISVAASVQDAMNEVQAAYQAEAPNVTITYNFGPSGSLAQQISQGAPTDVFLSASKKWMDNLVEEDQILEGSRQNLLQNAIVLIVPQAETNITDFQALDADSISKVAIGEPESSPAGRYAKEVLTAMNLFEPLQSKLVFGKDVRQVLSYVATGNVDAGLVYATDALLSDQVQAIATAPADTHSPIVYPVAVVQDSTNAEAAQAFVDFLSTDTAVAIFVDYGFSMAE